MLLGVWGDMVVPGDRPQLSDSTCWLWLVGVGGVLCENCIVDASNVYRHMLLVCGGGVVVYSLFFVCDCVVCVPVQTCLSVCSLGRMVDALAC